MNRIDPPRSDELEVSIIGPGRGETLVVHLGQNEWAVVDSCVARGSSVPAAIEYLNGFGVDAVERIRLVLATHWHDDHIRGLSRILSKAAEARFGCSMALRADEFLTLVGLATDEIEGMSGVDELAAVLEQLGSRHKAGSPPHLVTPLYAIENRELLNLTDPQRPFPIRIRALSPSDASIQRALQEVAALIPRPGDPVRGIQSTGSPNHASVVLWLEAADQRVLLGADLEYVPNGGRGWSAVLHAHADPILAGVVKVPHHGSPGADCPEVWERLLAPNPIALLAPYNGGRWLPSPADQQRISSRTPNAYCTARQGGAPPRREGFVEKEIERSAKSRKVVGQSGHIRIRWRVADQGAQPTVELFNGAYRLPPAAAA